MANTVLAMQGGAATSIGATFDGQPMQKGVHPTVENPNSALGHSCAKAVQPASTHPLGAQAANSLNKHCPDAARLFVADRTDGAILAVQCSECGECRIKT